MILSEVKHIPKGLTDALAIAFLVVRIAYLGDKPTLRSILWGLGLTVPLAIFFAPLYEHTTV